MMSEQSKTYKDYNSTYLVASMKTVLSMIERLTIDLDNTIDNRTNALEQMAIKHGLDDEPEWIYENINAEFYVDEQAVRILYASLAVIIASAAESVVDSICKDYKIQLGKRPSWGEKKSSVERTFKLSLETINGFNSNKRARLLGNCFKHSDGYVTKELAEFTGLIEGSEILYEEENWQKLIAETDKFLEGLCELIANKP